MHGVRNKLWTTWDRKVGDQLIGELAKTQGSEKNAIFQGGEYNIILSMLCVPELILSVVEAVDAGFLPTPDHGVG